MKKCLVCQQIKADTEFHKRAKSKDGIHPYCKDCRKGHSKNYVCRNKEKIIKKRKRYYQEHRSDLLQKSKLKLKIIRESPKKTPQNKECCNCKLMLPSNQFHKHISRADGLSSLCKKCTSINDKLRIEQRKAFYKTESQLQKRRLRESNKLKADPTYRLEITYRNYLKRAMKRNSVTARSKYKDFLGCSVAELRTYLESKFKPGMSWDNYGQFGWHVDHIIPCASFDLSVLENLKKCFHYTNLQPLWWQDNIKKRDKLIAA